MRVGVLMGGDTGYYFTGNGLNVEYNPVSKGCGKRLGAAGEGAGILLGPEGTNPPCGFGVFSGQTMLVCHTGSFQHLFLITARVCVW